MSSGPDPGIERRLWFLWLQGIEQAPPLVRRCLESWRHWNPDWHIELVDEDRLRLLLPEYHQWVGRWEGISPAARSDLVRLNLLYHHGGVWTDATCLCRMPLDAWLAPVSTQGFFAFANPGWLRPLSSWFLAARPDSQLLARWREEANGYWVGGFGRRGVDYSELAAEPRFADHRRDTALWFDPSREELATVYPYFWVHFLFARMLREPHYAALWEAVPKVTANIPHRLHHLGLDHPMTAALALEFRRSMAPFYKLTTRSGLDIHDPSILLGYCLDPANW
jgi:hypothetical protein